MNKKILTLLLVGGLLLGTSGVGVAYANTAHSSQRQDQAYQVQKENVEKRQIQNRNENVEKCQTKSKNKNAVNRQNQNNEERHQHGENAISIYSEISGMTEDEISEYMKDNECGLKELATKNKDMEKLRETLRKDK